MTATISKWGLPYY